MKSRYQNASPLSHLYSLFLEARGRRRLGGEGFRRWSLVGRRWSVGGKSGLIRGGQLFDIFNAKSQVAQQAIVQAVYPAVNDQFLPARPGVLHHRRLTHIDDLLD